MSDLGQETAAREAAREHLERNIAETQRDVALDQRDAVIVDNVALSDQAQSATNLAAHNATQRMSAEHARDTAEADAKTNATALYTLLGVIAVVLIGFLVWYYNRPPDVAQAPVPIINNVPVPSAPPVQPTAPAPTSVTVNAPPAAAPVIATPPAAAPSTTVVVTPPAPNASAPTPVMPSTTPQQAPVSSGSAPDASGTTPSNPSDATTTPSTNSPPAPAPSDGAPSSTATTPASNP